MDRVTLKSVAVEKSVYSIAVSFRDSEDGNVTPGYIAWTLSELDGTIVNSRENVQVETPSYDIDIVLSGDDLAKTTGLLFEPRILHVAAECTTDLGTYISKKEFLFYIEDTVTAAALSTTTTTSTTTSTSTTTTS